MAAHTDAPLAFELAALLADALEDSDDLGSFASASVVLLDADSLAGLPGVVLTLGDGRSFSITVAER